MAERPYKIKAHQNFTSPALLLSLLVFVLTWLFYGNIMERILPVVDGAKFMVNDFESPFTSMLLFCFCVALVPMGIFGIWSFAPIHSSNYRFLSAIVISGTVTGAIVYRYFDIKSHLKMISAGSSFETLFPVEEVYYEFYVLGGLCLGLLVSYAFFRESNK